MWTYGCFQYSNACNGISISQACLLDCYTKSQIKTCGCAEYGFLTATARDEVCDETDEETGILTIIYTTESSLKEIRF